MISPPRKPSATTSLRIACNLSGSTFSRARLERDNETFFRTIDTTRDAGERMAFMFVATIVGFAIVLAVAGPSGYVALLVLALANVLMLLQMHMLRRFWHTAISRDSDNAR